MKKRVPEGMPATAMENPLSYFFRQTGIYFAFGMGLVKIGYTTEPNARLRSIRTAHKERPDMVIFVPIASARELERTLHEKFKSARAYGEWFVPNDALMECIEGFLSQAADMTLNRACRPGMLYDVGNGYTCY